MPLTTSSDYFAVHAHSEFSWLDGMGSVQDMVAKVERMGQPALALTDHGSMAGCIRLYKACTKAGIAPFPGIEAYVVTDVTDDDAKKERFHLGLLALDYEGYRALINLSSRSNLRDRFHKKPLIDLADLSSLAADHGDHVAVTTGCYFGLIVQQMVNHGPAHAMAMMEWLRAIFPHVFVEVQNHNITHDDGATDLRIATDLLDIAERLSLPVVLGQDSHYCDHGDQPVHDLMKDICYFGDAETDNSFPGGPYHLASVGWLRKQGWTDEQWDRIEEGHEHLLDLNQVTMPALDSYKFHVPMVSFDPDRTLRTLAKRRLEALYLDGINTYDNRLDYELRVIKEKGFANYFLMAEDIASWCRRNGIFIDARGSANGSLICYVIGVTTVDSVQWGCDFDRFLSLDRTKPPDIDIDVEHDRRDDLIAYVRSKYPSMVQIGTYSRIGIKATEDGEDKGSVYVQYAAAKRAKEGVYYGIDDDDRPMLEALAEADVRKSAGAHAGGFVIPGDGLAIEDYLATMLIPSSGTTVTQAPMDDVEDCGYVKLDILGLKQLSTMRRVMEAIGKDPVVDGMTWVPDDDKKALAVLRSGKVGNGVFQFEGYTTAKGAKDMKVNSTQEGIFCLALFRPAMMMSGMTDRYLAARAAKQRETLHPGVDHIMDSTWGVPIFQDQVIKIMRAIGLPVTDLNDLLKAVKASNDKIAEYARSTFDRVYPIFVRCAMRNLTDCSRDDAERIWQTVMDFSDYGFNQSHATNYGIRGYRMAYLKAHYPTEFMAATLATWAGSKDKEPQYISEARRSKMVIARPDVNRSDVLWRADGPLKLRKGLLSIKGVGYEAAVAIVQERNLHGDYQSIQDFSDRLPARPVSGVKALPKGDLKGVCKHLAEAGALKVLGWDPDA